MPVGLRIWLPAIRAGSGADVFTLRLAEALARAGHTPTLRWFDRRYELTPWLLRSVQAPPEVDLVHAGSWQGFAFKRTGVPLIITEHQYVAHSDFAPYRSLPQALYHRLFAERWARRSYAQADAVVAVSEFCADGMRAALTKPVTVIHNWVDTDRFSPLDVIANDKEYKQKTLPLKLLFVGNPSRWKGNDLLPEIATQLGPNFEIFCLGGLRKNFNPDHLPPNVRLLSRTMSEQMPEIYRSVDVALVLSRYEAFGYVALEAMASGLPVLGFNSSGTAEVCASGSTALLAPIDDVPQLVAYARQLAENPALRQKLGIAGRQRAVKCFGERMGLRAYLDVYRHVLKPKSVS